MGYPTLAKYINEQMNTLPTDTSGYPTISDTSQGQATYISKAQALLSWLGYYQYPFITGIFDFKTTEAVKSFQADISANVTGIVDAHTWRVLAYRASVLKVSYGCLKFLSAGSQGKFDPTIGGAG